jgi:hypothetical protein
MKLFAVIKAKPVGGVPSQRVGGFHDTESQKFYDNSSDACIAFNALKDRFFAIYCWKNFCNNTLADFHLYDAQGHMVTRMAQIGDFVKIEILASHVIGIKYYWVKIKEIIHEQDFKTERYLITFVPSSDPSVKIKRVIHFYSGNSSSTFMIARDSQVLTAGVYGRNEAPNLKTDPINCIINIVISFGAMTGLSKVQWKNFTESILDFDKFFTPGP